MSICGPQLPVTHRVQEFLVTQSEIQYCQVPAGWGLQQTTRAPGSDKTRGQGSFGPFTGGVNLTERFTYVNYLDRANLVITT